MDDAATLSIASLVRGYWRAACRVRGIYLADLAHEDAVRLLFDIARYGPVDRLRCRAAETLAGLGVDFAVMEREDLARVIRETLAAAMAEGMNYRGRTERTVRVVCALRPGMTRHDVLAVVNEVRRAERSGI